MNDPIGDLIKMVSANPSIKDEDLYRSFPQLKNTPALARRARIYASSKASGDYQDEDLDRTFGDVINAFAPRVEHPSPMVHPERQFTPDPAQQDMSNKLAQYIKQQNLSPNQASTQSNNGFNEDFANQILEKNKNLNFVQRYLNPDQYPKVQNSDGSYSTHRMASTDNFIYPTIVQDKTTGKLKQLTPEEAYKYAMRTGEYINAGSPQAADWLAENGYKEAKQNTNIPFRSEQQQAPAMEDPNDPLGSMLHPIEDQYQQLSEQKRNLLNQFAGKDNTTMAGLPHENIPSLLDISSQQKELQSQQDQIRQQAQNNYVPPRKAQQALQDLIHQTHPDAPDISGLSIQQIDQWLPMNKAGKQNETAKYLLSQYQNGRNVQDALKNAQTLPQAALNYAYSTDPDLYKQLDAVGGDINKLSPAAMGTAMTRFLDNPALKAWVGKNPANKEVYDHAVTNVFTNFPSFGKKMIAEKLANAREEQGYNNPLGNVLDDSSDPGKTTANDALFNDLVQKGELPPSAVPLYQQMRGKLDYYVPTPGVADAILNHTTKGFGNIIEGVKDWFKSGGEATNDAVERQYATPQLKTKGLLHDLTYKGGNFIGDMVPLMLISKGLTGAGLSAKMANSIATGMTFQHDNRMKAALLYPGDTQGQNVYTAVTTGFDAFIGSLYDRGKALSVLDAEVKPALKQIVDQFTSGEISAQAAKDLTQTEMGNFLSKAKDFGLTTLKHNAESSAQMMGYSLGHDMIDYAFGKRDDIDTSDAIQSGLTAFLYNAPLAALAAHGERDRAFKMTAGQLYDIASHPEVYRDAIQRDYSLSDSQRQEKLDNLDKAASVQQDLEQFDLTPRQKQNVLLHELNQSVLEKQLKATQSNFAQDQLKERLKQSKEAVQNILTQRADQVEATKDQTPQEVKEFVKDNTQVNEPQSEDNSTTTQEQPAEQQEEQQPAYTTKSGKYSVQVQEGRRLVVENKTGKIVPEYNGSRRNKTVYNVLREHDENVNYNTGETADHSKAPQFASPEEADRWTIENSSNPSQIAEVYDRTPKEAEPLSSKEHAIAEYGIGKVTEQSYDRFGDPNNKSNGKARTYFNNTKGRSLDVIAKEISDHTGLDIQPQDVVDFIDRFPNGDSHVARDGEIRQQAAAKFKDLTGIDLTDRIAQNASAQGLSKEAEQQHAQQVHEILSEPLPEEELYKMLKEQSEKTIDENDLNLDNYGHATNDPGELAAIEEANSILSQDPQNMGADHPREAAGHPATDVFPNDHEPAAHSGADTGHYSESEQGEPADAEAGAEVMLQGASVPYIKELMEHDVNPVLKETGRGLKGLVDLLVRGFSPKTGVSEKAISELMKTLGSRNEAELAIDKAFSAFQKLFDKMKDADRINFIDRLKTGQKQITPELQQVADLIKNLDKQLYDQIAHFKPSLTWKEDHFRVLWKVIPGSTTGKQKLWSSMVRRPFQGSKGFMKKATLADMSEGIKMGGEPTTTNPIKMFKLAYADGMKFVTAQRMFEALKQNGFVKFVPFGKSAPEGFVPINDRMAKVYYPTPEGMVNKGEWQIEAGAGRLLNNHLSKDYLREKNTPLGAVGSGLMTIKNLYTQVELSLSGFHAIAEGLETVGSQIGLGLRKLFNLGIMKGDPKMVWAGAKDIATSPLAWLTTAKMGRQMVRYASDSKYAEKFAQDLIKKYPDAEQYIHDYHIGGGLMKQHEDMKTKAFETLKEQVNKDNYIGATLRLFPSINEAILSPLFERLIPAWKVGMFMKEFPVALKEQEARINKGTTTREEVARKTVAFIEDRLGEMNFDSLFLDRTFKTAQQFMMRSVTWKLGNIRGMLGALPEQAMEFRNAARENRAPILMPKAAWLFGLATMQVVLASAIQKFFAKKDVTSFKDIVAPQINEKDESERVILPTYFKDFLHMWHSKLGYVTTSMSGPISKMYDVWNNKNFYNYEIYDTHAPLPEKLKDVAGYLVPQPFSVSSSLQMIEKGEPASKVGMSFLGLNKAPGYITHSPVENEIFDLYNQRHLETKPYEQKKADDMKKEIRTLYKSGKKQEAEDLANDAIKKGILRNTQIRYLLSHVGKDQDASLFFFDKLPFEDKKYLLTRMNDEEKKTYDPKGKVAAQAKIQEANGE